MVFFSTRFHGVKFEYLLSTLSDFYMQTVILPRPYYYLHHIEICIQALEYKILSESIKWLWGEMNDVTHISVRRCEIALEYSALTYTLLTNVKNLKFSNNIQVFFFIYTKHYSYRATKYYIIYYDSVCII